MRRAFAGTRLRSDDRGEMMVLMFGLTALLLGLGGTLMWLLGRPLGIGPVGANQDAALAGGVVLRQQALAAGLRAGDVVSATAQLDVGRACDAASQAARGDGAQLLTCMLDPNGLTVVTAWDGEHAREDGQNLQSGVVSFLDSADGCLALSTSWGDQLPSVCGDAETSANPAGNG
jgi:hypothetical protein